MPHKEFVFVFALAALLRVDGLFVSPLWYDEILSLQRARLPLSEHVHANPNAWEIMLRLFAHPYLIRVPSLVCSLVAIWLAWLVMTELEFAVPQKMTAMFLLACLPGLIWMAQDARYYSGVSLAFMASLYFALAQRWLSLSLVIVIAFFIHPTAPAYLIPALYFAVFNKYPKRILTAGIPAFIFAILGVFIFSRFAVVESSFWLERTDATYILAQYMLAIGAHPDNIVAASFFLLFAGMCIVLSLKARPLMIFLLPIAIIIIVSTVYKPVAFYRTLQPSLFGLAMLIGSSVTVRTPSAYLLIVPLVLMLVQYDPGVHAGHIENGTALVRNTFTAEDCIHYEDEFSRTATALLLDGLPQCTSDLSAGRAWVISTVYRDSIPVFTTDGWHFPVVYFYAP